MFMAQMSAGARARCALLVMVALACGCASRPNLAPTPILWARSDEDPFADLPAALQTPTVEIIYGTDRVPSLPDEKGNVQYGADRSDCLEIGTCTVRIGKDATWEQIVEQSRKTTRNLSLPLEVVSIHPVATFAKSGDPPLLHDGEVVEEPERVAADQRAVAALHQTLAKRLAETPHKEVVLYVHGYNNSFEVAARRMADLWHFLGRRGVPVIYSWPAGFKSGPVRAYTHDTESAEFTVYHLKQFIRAVAACSEVQKIHLIAHSRGTAVLITAMRELHLETGGSAMDTRRRLKLGNVILAAPDMDMQVAAQRVAAERLGLIPERATIYLNADDRAIGLSGWLFSSMQRIGRLVASDYTEEQRARMQRLTGVNFVQVKAKTDFLGHGYFISNPCVLSDLILVLRDNKAPGVEHGRPLISAGGGFWVLYDGYPGPRRGLSALTGTTRPGAQTPAD